MRARTQQAPIFIVDEVPRGTRSTRAVLQGQLLSQLFPPNALDAHEEGRAIGRLEKTSPTPRSSCAP